MTGLEIRNADRLQARLSAAAETLADALSPALMEIAAEGMELARELAPEGSPPRKEARLKDSFSCEGEGLRAAVRVSNPHAAYVEFGTGRRGAASGGVSPVRGGYDPDWPGMSAQPYLYPMAERMKADFAVRMGQALVAHLAGKEE